MAAVLTRLSEPAKPVRVRLTTGTMQLRQQTIEALRLEMEHFYKNADLSELLFLQNALEFADGERDSSLPEQCPLSEAALFCITGKGFRD